MLIENFKETMEFLTTAVISIPEHIDRDSLDALVRAERARSKELAGSGELLRAWRTPGYWGNWCLWREPNVAALVTALDSLPLSQFMEITIHSLEPHPGDPGPTSRLDAH
ncbi:muconolactone Delta-isomerase family protein [Arthrobacter sp. MI7-26]|uniref:muconolactone Delta-isomerase n=1 Tax=Arthrobacter sp. MI7-26 TaxID=2993653 RepID=UPI0022488473|nr:muconolactone Delta-isomerase family protein [Arthrobacter sp. MI7-26]MCX2748997.1 muconolactone Delta-isomerase family protein [Arthrobacter sp. MI7-26]